MEDYQGILFPYAYNILGSAEDAKDAVQDVLYNYFSSQKEGIENVKNYLIKSVINQSINIKNKRKKLVGEDVWLPEPVATEKADTDINLRDIASYSLLILLEQLNPRERAVFILKEAFAYSHEEIAEVLSGTVENSRKLLSRAKAKLNQSQQLAKSSAEAVSLEFLEKYITAIRSRDTQTLESIMSDDIAYFADGGGKLKVVKKVCTGLQEVADHLILVYHRYQSKTSLVAAVINHQPALLFYQNGKLVTCQVFGITPDQSKINQINVVLDPDKLKMVKL